MQQHFNPVSKIRFTGQNLESLIEAETKNNYPSNRWITYKQAKELGVLNKNMAGNGVKLRCFPKDEKTGKTHPFSYRVFNLSLFDDVPLSVKRIKVPTLRKSTPAIKEKKETTKTESFTGSVAIPVQGEPNVFLIQTESGFKKVTIS